MDGICTKTDFFTKNQKQKAHKARLSTTSTPELDEASNAGYYDKCLGMDMILGIWDGYVPKWREHVVFEQNEETKTPWWKDTQIQTRRLGLQEKQPEPIEKLGAMDRKKWF